MVMFCSFSVCLWFGTYLIHHVRRPLAESLPPLTPLFHI